MKTVTIIVPCFNEHESLPYLIRELDKVDKNIQFLIVDNGSEDETKNYLNSISKNLNKNISKNQGYEFHQSA